MVGIFGLATALLAVSTSAQEAEPSSPPSRLEQKLEELRDLLQKGLLSKGLYHRKVGELLDRYTDDDGSEASRRDTIHDITGTWRLRVEELSLWAPYATLDKTLGTVVWEIAWIDGELILREYRADPEASYPFEEMELRDLAVRDDLIAFKVESAFGFVETYRLERLTADEIRGSYTMSYGNGNGPESEYRGRLVLERLP